MAEKGILSADERVELIRGVVREMSPANRAHVIAVTRSYNALLQVLAGRASVYQQAPLAFGELDSEPEPDVVVCSQPEARGLWNRCDAALAGRRGCRNRPFGTISAPRRACTPKPESPSIGSSTSWTECSWYSVTLRREATATARHMLPAHWCRLRPGRTSSSRSLRFSRPSDRSPMSSGSAFRCGTFCIECSSERADALFCIPKGSV